VSEDGPFFSYHDATSTPSPTQHPHPPIWGAASTTWESFQWIGAQGLGLLITPILSSLAEFSAKLGAYRGAFSGGPSDMESRPQVAASVPLYIADTEEQARSEARGYLDSYLAVWTDAANSWNDTSSAAYQGYSGFGRMLQGTTGSDLIARGSAIVGTPDSVVEQIRALSAGCELTSADQILWQVDYGGMPITRSGRTLQLFIDKVLPQFG
jgi:alkanesulfonate monooxygenase SsuD/methylene tetrahydromethanopterin reductase-like flavin-dependent oxidoreductase (luciferase family)